MRLIKMILLLEHDGKETKIEVPGEKVEGFKIVSKYPDGEILTGWPIGKDFYIKRLDRQKVYFDDKDIHDIKWEVFDENQHND